VVVTTKLMATMTTATMIKDNHNGNRHDKDNTGLYKNTKQINTLHNQWH
jgi:hypothetical protein